MTKISTKTKKADKPVWLKYTEKEVKDIILNIVKKDPEITSEKIGLILRDSYGIPKTKIYGFKVNQVLKEAKIDKNTDIINLKKKVEKLSKHLEKNKQDARTQRSLMINKAKLRKIERYAA